MEEEVGERSRVRVSVPGMDCGSCARKVGNSLDSVDGALDYTLNTTSGTATVTVDPERAGRSDVVEAVEAAGYEVTDDDRGSVWRTTRALKTWVSGALLALGLAAELLAHDLVLLSVLGRELLVADAFFLAAAGMGGQEILRNGYYSFRNRSLDIDFLMSAAILGAVTAGVVGGARLYFEAATLAFLFSVAELLERYSMDRARGSLRELMELSPDRATVRRDGDWVGVPVEEVGVGDRVAVEPGGEIPVDGVVVEGGGAVNEAPVTGESIPVDKEVGDEVYAGTVNESGYLEVRSTAEADDNTMSRIIGLVEEAQERRTRRERFVDRFAGVYTPVMVGAAVLVAGVPPLLGEPWLPWFVNGITLLVLACPCAFVISTPVSVVSGITSAARNGVLVKGGDYLEALGEVDVVAFDKTGTLTLGELRVTDVVPLNGHTREEVLRCARGVEMRSEHPIADAITRRAEGGDERDVRGFESIAGKGVRAEVGGVQHYAGKPDMFSEMGFDLEHVHAVPGEGLEDEYRDLCEREGCLNVVEDTLPRLQGEGKTVVLVGTEDEVEGLIAVADEVRPEARRVVEELHGMGVRTVMLTGDNEATARAVAGEVGVDEYYAGLLPEEKVRRIEGLSDGGVAMVGDGVNDAPALAAASVGVAMGAAGTDAALETADVALMADDLTKLPYAVRLSRKAGSVIRENVWSSLGVKLLLAAGVPLGFVGVAAAVLLGDAGMTLAVTGNALRLGWVEAED